MTYLNAIILGIAQGATEFLPVSSSGHLAILQYLFHVDGDSVVLFTILLHVGTLVSVFLIYRRDIWLLIKELFITIIDLLSGKGLRLNERPMRKLGIMIIVASIPTGVIGILFDDLFSSFYKSLVPIGIGLIITGFLLWVAENKREGKVGIEDMKFRNAIFIGLLQGIAICPGISRSGSTLVGGLFSKLDRDFAVEFAFLISIPAILGSLIFEMGDANSISALQGNMGPILVGGTCAAISGIIAIKTMITVVKKYSLKYFSIYVWILGIAIVTLEIL